MRYYEPGDNIFFFGFSRGSYTARFLSEMLDFVGLLQPGNEELIRFAWKTFAKWQQRKDATEKDKEERSRLFAFMKAFRETFSRPVSRIRFLGLFDTVNSVPMFENAWLERSKFPYTAQTTARVIRHAVSIDERRAKFRQDLISEVKPLAHDSKHPHRLRRFLPRDTQREQTEVPEIVLNATDLEEERKTRAETLPGLDEERYRVPSTSPNRRQSTETMLYYPIESHLRVPFLGNRFKSHISMSPNMRETRSSKMGTNKTSQKCGSQDNTAMLEGAGSSIPRTIGH